MSTRSPKEGKELEALDRLIEEITVDAYGDDEQLWAFRQAFEDDVDDPFNDPITRSNDLKDAGERAEAEKILMELCRVDLRCLDAHSHLGNFIFDHHPKDAIRHYEVGLRIGDPEQKHDQCTNHV